MKFINSTSWPAKLEVGSPGDTEMLAMIGCKATYRFADGVLVPVSRDEAWPIFDKPHAYAGVQLGPDLEFRREATDVVVFGTAMAPAGQPVERMMVAIQCGAIDFQVVVTGDRWWVPSGSQFVPTAPVPFLEMALGNDRAYGGSVAVNDAEAAHPVNPAGRGFHLDRSTVDRSPLPNLERADALITQWTDAPGPACFFRTAGWPGTLDIAPGAEPIELARRAAADMVQQSVPELTAPPARLDSQIRLTGMSPAGELIVPMPAATGPVADVEVGSLRGRFASSLGSIVVLVPQRVLVAAYVCLFRYLFRPLEERSVTLSWAESAAASQPPAVEGAR